MTRSMSDKQMLAKYGYDKKPWIDPTNPNGQRFTTGGEIRFGRTVIQRNLDPRPESIPSPDPKPFVCDLSSVNARLAKYVGLCEHYAPRPWGSFIPDPEFVRSEVNPILSAFRDDWGLSIYGNAGLTAVWVAALLKRSAKRYFLATDEQVDSARVILERLARLLSTESEGSE